MSINSGSLWDRLPHRVSVQRMRRRRSGSLGDTTPRKRTISENVEAWIQPGTPQTVQQAGAVRERVSHVIFFATRPTLRNGDEITHTATVPRGETEAQTLAEPVVFLCHGVSDATAGLGVGFQAFAEEMRSGVENQAKT